jgi:sulfoxide reductase catalytic subunit YedY
MIIRKQADLRYSDITPKSAYLNRRRFLGAGAAALGALTIPFGASAAKLAGVTKSPFSTDEAITPFDGVTHYNNYYEFGTEKDQPAQLAKNFHTSPWTVVVGGEVAKPKTLDLDAIMKTATSNAKFVAFETYFDKKQMPQAAWAGIRIPYVEGLRLDEAMHPLALLSVGMYGETLPPQNGAPFRLVIPWKYGYKSIKSIVKITLVEKQPPTSWNLSQPDEYGFYSNVNPEVDHPRWSQKTERRLGELRMRNTLKFNGYESQVASLYAGMDLHRYH